MVSTDSIAGMFTDRRHSNEVECDQDLPVKALRILAHLSISFGKSPVTGQKCSVPNFFSAISFTLPPILSDHIVLLSMAILPHTPPLAFIFADHPDGSASAGLGLGVYSLRGGGGGGFDIGSE